MKPVVAEKAIVHAPRRKLPRAPGTVRELVRLLVDGGRWWMVPMVAVLGLSAVLLAAVAAVEYVAPFVYTIF